MNMYLDLRLLNLVAF